MAAPTGAARSKLALMADRVMGKSVRSAPPARKRVKRAAKGNYGGAAPSSASRGRAGGMSAPSSKSPGTGNSFTGGYNPSRFAKTGMAPTIKTPRTSGYDMPKFAKTGIAKRAFTMRSHPQGMSTFARRGISTRSNPQRSFAKSRFAK